MLQHEPVYRMIVESGKEQGDQLKSSKEKDRLAKSIEFISSNWDIISTLAKEHRDNIAKVLTIVSDHHDSMQCINKVIPQGDKMLNTTPSGVFDIQKGRKNLKRIRVSVCFSCMYGGLIMLLLLEES